MAKYRWLCQPIQPSVPTGPAAPAHPSYIIDSALPPVSGDDYAALQSEVADLRRQLAEAQCTASSERARRIDKSNVAEHWQREHVKVTEEAANLRRQLAECQTRCQRMDSFCAVHGVEVSRD